MRWRGTGGVTSPSRSVPGSAPGAYVNFGDGPYWNTAAPRWNHPQTNVARPNVIQVKPKQHGDYYTKFEYDDNGTTREATVAAGYIPYITPDPMYEDSRKRYSGPDLEPWAGALLPTKVGLLVIDFYIPELVAPFNKGGAPLFTKLIPELMDKLFTAFLPEYVVYDGHVYNFYNNFWPRTPAIATAPLYRIQGWASNKVIETASTLSARTALSKTPAGRWKGFHYSNSELNAIELLNEFGNLADVYFAGSPSTNDNVNYAHPAMTFGDVAYNDYTASIMTPEAFSDIKYRQKICKGNFLDKWGLPFILSPDSAGSDTADLPMGLYVHDYGVNALRPDSGLNADATDINRRYFKGQRAVGYFQGDLAYSHYYNNNLTFGCFESMEGIRTLCFDCPLAEPCFTGTQLPFEQLDPRLMCYPKQKGKLSEGLDPLLQYGNFFLVTPIPEPMLYECFDTREVPAIWARNYITTT